MRSERRIYRDGCPCHIYSKGINGFCIFYDDADYIYFLTLYYILAREYNVRTMSICLMRNHFHSLSQFGGREVMVGFIRELCSRFAINYNLYHKRTGQLFQEPFGSAPKITGKKLKGTFAYVNNNAVAGMIVKNAIEYRWDLLPYYYSDHPFSEPLVKRNCRSAMRRSLKYVDVCFREGQPIGYSVQSRIFNGLNDVEAAQLKDYVISKYNPVDYQSMIHWFGSFEKAVSAFETTAGEEYDLPEDWEDYSCYEEMVAAVASLGYVHPVNFESLDRQQLEELFYGLSYLTGAPAKQIRKFLHLRPLFMEKLPVITSGRDSQIIDYQADA